jgi:hypothetical protein
MSYPDEEEVHDTVVHLARLEHPLRTDRPPDKRGAVDYLGAVASEALSVLWRTEIWDIAHHPSEDCFLNQLQSNVR